MTIRFWVTTDPQLGRQGPTDPSDLEDHLFVNHISTTMGPDDILICLGNIAMKDPRYWSRNLGFCNSCLKWLVRGPHDSKSYTWYLQNGWDFTGEQIIVARGGLQMIFSHYPLEDVPPRSVNIYGQDREGAEKQDSDQYFKAEAKGLQRLDKIINGLKR
jgi:calcineurin-like phosphoesterase family protein